MLCSYPKADTPLSPEVAVVIRPPYPPGVTAEERERELQRIAGEARAAESRRDGWAANELWRRYELVRDAGRDPDELLAEGIALSRIAIDLAGQGR